MAGSEIFDADKLAKVVMDQSNALANVDYKQTEDRLALGAKLGQEEFQLAAKIREELDPLWKDPEKLRALGLAMRAQGSKVSLDSTSDGLPSEFTIDAPRNGDNVIVTINHRGFNASMIDRLLGHSHTTAVSVYDGRDGHFHSYDKLDADTR